MDGQSNTKAKRTRHKQQDAPKNDMFTLWAGQSLKVEVVKEYIFHPVRRWRFDYAIPEWMIALEVEGGTFKKRTYTDKRTGEKITTYGGRHNSSVGFLGDMKKYNAAGMLGWRVFRVTPQELMSYKTLTMLQQARKVCMAKDDKNEK